MDGYGMLKKILGRSKNKENAKRTEGSENFTKEHRDRIESYNHFIAQFEPQGVVDIAFKTDESLK